MQEGGRPNLGHLPVKLEELGANCDTNCAGVGPTWPGFNQAWAGLHQQGLQPNLCAASSTLGLASIKSRPASTTFWLRSVYIGFRATSGGLDSIQFGRDSTGWAHIDELRAGSDQIRPKMCRLQPDVGRVRPSRRYTCRQSKWAWFGLLRGCSAKFRAGSTTPRETSTNLGRVRPTWQLGCFGSSSAKSVKAATPSDPMGVGSIDIGAASTECGAGRSHPFLASASPMWFSSVAVDTGSAQFGVGLDRSRGWFDRSRGGPVECPSLGKLRPDLDWVRPSVVL